MDCWRTLHASERDYSYSSKFHGVYTQIDLLLTDQSTLDLLVDSTIEQITISDHAPVTLLLVLPHHSARVWQWKLNENLLDDFRVVVGVEETLSNYFTKNANGEVNEILWEGHKVVVRGSFIAWGSKLKKKSQADFQRVLGALKQAELGHKCMADPEEL